MAFGLKGTAEVVKLSLAGEKGPVKTNLNLHHPKP